MSPVVDTEDTGLYQVSLEGINVSLAEAHEGFERAFDTWYESDHFYAGGVLVPGVLSGSRWYAGRARRQNRFVADENVLADPRAGTNLATYFVTTGGLDGFRDYIVPRLPILRAQGRMFEERTLVHVGFYRLDIRTGEEGLPDHAIGDGRFAAVTMILGVDAPAASGRPGPGEVILGLSIDSADGEPPPNIPVPAPKLPGKARLVLAFSPTDPGESATETEEHVRRVGAVAGVEPVWGGSFLPVVPGYQSYIETLR